MKTKVLLTLLIKVFLAIVVTAVYSISIRNTEKQKKENFNASQINIENTHSTMWSIIQQKAQVSDEYKSAFDTIYTHMMSERYSQGDGSLMKWITESNPQFDVSLYKDLSQSIEVQRTLLREEQKRLLDIVRDYNVFISVFPNSFLLSDKEPLVAKIITSTRSKKALESGIDDNLELF